MTPVPLIRIRPLGSAGVNPGGDYVLYWMTAFRRGNWNFSLQRAVEWGHELRKPLVVLEALRCGYPWASDRLHGFVIQGMRDNARHFQRTSIHYYPYLEPEPGAGQGLLATLAMRACAVVGDDFPCFFLPRMVAAAERQIPVRTELVDANGLLPLRAAPKVFARAVDFRRFLQKNLLPHLDAMPLADPLEGPALPVLPRLPREIMRRWPAADVEAIAAAPTRLAEYPIDHTVPMSPIAGGAAAATATLREFIARKLPRYETARREPAQDASSGLSPYLHFGHISAHQIFTEVMARDGWSAAQVSPKLTASAQGWWRASSEAESFLDELITWRELGYNLCWQQADYDQYESLPAWARRTLAQHARDPRAFEYSLEQFSAAATHDPLWNAAQRQLLREGRIHNYLRMLWGKKILEWTPTPQEALQVMIELNNRLALDGRNPNSYSGIFWVLGRYDRPWAPERPIFGQVRYMSSDNTARKMRVQDYLRKFAE